MEIKKIADRKVKFHCYNTVIVGAGAAGMNCAVHLQEFMRQNRIKDPHERVIVITGGVSLGTSRMSGSDKQTYYKMGTGPEMPDSALDFAKTLTAGGCCHDDLALAEAVGSLREFYHLVRAGVPFPHDALGSYVGYKTDNDPYERATSAGPKTSKYMSECLEKQARSFGIEIHDQREVAEFLTTGSGVQKRLTGVITIDKSGLSEKDYALNIYLCNNLVLAAGGPGELYKTSVYPKGQVGIHGIAFKAGLAAENLTESQFGLASIKFRWNVSGSYCQAVPRIFSTDKNGKDEQDFLAPFFPTLSKMATNIFLKGYQWPFDTRRIENYQSSLIDILVYNETQKDRRVFMDFLHNPRGRTRNQKFNFGELEPQAVEYLKNAGALQAGPIERLYALNPPAIEIYKKHGIDLLSEPLEIAVCAQHNNGGFSVNKWWESNIPGTFVIGEMAGTHGVKRPGGSALNAGQVGGLRAAEYIVNACGTEMPHYSDKPEIERQLTRFINRLEHNRKSSGIWAEELLTQIRSRMTKSAGHIRELNDARNSLKEALDCYRQLQKQGVKVRSKDHIVPAIRAEHLALTSILFLKAIVELLQQGSGSRGSHLVLSEDGTEINPEVKNNVTGRPLRFKPENKKLRNLILRIKYEPNVDDLFTCENIPVRPIPADRKAFEPAWRDFREGKIYEI